MDDARFVDFIVSERIMYLLENYHKTRKTDIEGDIGEMLDLFLENYFTQEEERSKLAEKIKDSFEHIWKEQGERENFLYKTGVEDGIRLARKIARREDL